MGQLGTGFMRRQGYHWITSGRVYFDFMQREAGGQARCDGYPPPWLFIFLLGCWVTVLREAP
jgi:hypothetical protein